MKKRMLALMLSLTMVFSALPSTMLQAEEAAGAAQASDEEVLGDNVALDAKASAGYTNIYDISTDAINDGKLADSTPSTSWNSWGGGADQYPLPVVLTWDKDYELTGMRVMYWADNAELEASGNVTFPKSCYVEYLDGDGNWQKISDVGVEFDASSNNGINGNNKKWNTVTFDQVITTKSLRLMIERNGSGTNGVGISEWEVFGTRVPDGIGEVGTNVAPKAAVAVEYTGEGASAANINDGILAENGDTSWNTWKAEGDLEYPTPVTLEWENLHEISSMQVMWWADNEKVQFPESCTVAYYDEKADEWVDVTDMVDENKENVSSVGVNYTETEGGANANNRYWNGVAFKKPFQTRKLRLAVNRPDGVAGETGVGIGEWEVYGEEIIASIGDGENIARKATAEAEYTNGGTSASNVNNGVLASGASTSWNTWNNQGGYPTPIALKWEEPYEISSMRVMYWADNANLTANGNVTFPKSCDVQYLDNATGEWVTITDMRDENDENVSTVGVKFTETNGGINANNRYWNGVLFKKPVRTTQIRLLLDRNGRGSNGVGIGEWEVFGERITNELFGAKITGKDKLAEEEEATYTGGTVPSEMADDVAYEWSVEEGSCVEIVGSANEKTVTVKGLTTGTAALKLTVSKGDAVKETEHSIRVEGIESVDTYQTATAAGKAPILPATVVVNGLSFDDPTPSLKSSTKPDFDFAETFNSKLMAVVWEEVDPADYAADQVGNTFTVKGYVPYGDEKFDALAEITVKEPAVVAEANSTVTFENVQLTDEFWSPKQKVNALSSLNAAIYRIGLASGGEPNFDNAIKKLNGEPYDEFRGYVFQDSDIYKSIEAISYTLSATQNDTDPEMAEQREKLQDKLNSWIEKIEKVQYADGYIDTFFTLRSTSYSGGGAPGTHRWRNMANHEMYNAGHFLESVVAYTRYREGIQDPDYRLYVVGKRFADEIVSLFGPGGTRHEVPGHEEIELALVKLGKLVEEYEGEGTGQKYFDTAKLLIDRRGESASLRESGYKGGDYSQDARAFVNETNGVGHAVRANYFYAGVTDIATLLDDDDADKAAYLNTLDTIWDSVANRKTYITGGIGVNTHGEDFGDDYELPNDKSYCETCAAIALANWNQRMNLVHEDAKYADVVEKTLYNAILVGTNLEGNLFYYSSLLQVSNGNRRSEWFACACCPPNLMRTIAALSGYMYTVHKNDVFVNMYIGSDGKVNVGGTQVDLKQETNYPWDGSVKLTVNPAQAKEFTMKIRIPGWVQEQKNNKVTIKVNGEEVTSEAEKGYVAITRTWNEADVIDIDIPMEIRKTEADPNVTTNTGKIALERGPIVYCMEKAGNAQLNSDISNFNPLNFVIPRDADLQAEYNEDLLKGVVEITGDVSYNNGSSIVDAKLQAVPYYAWNNRGDDGVYGQNSSTKMLIWTTASGEVETNPAVQRAMEAIEAIGTVTATQACKERIDAARKAYDIVSAAQKPSVSNVQVLLDAEAEYERLVAEQDEKFAELANWITFMESLDEEAYTAQSWAALETATNAAKALVEEKTATQAQIDRAISDMIAAFGKLEYGVQKQHLQAAVDAAQTILNRAVDYEEDSLAALKSVMEEAKALLADKEATQEEVNQMAGAVIDAIVQVATDAGVASLESLIKAVESLEGSKYTAESKAALDAAVEAAKEVLADADRKEGDLAAAYSNLADALRGLELKGNKAALKAVIDKASEVLENASEYTDSSISGLGGALEKAMGVYEDENAAQGAVNAATEELTRELVKARLKGDVNGDGRVDTKDATSLLKYSAELAELDTGELEGADVNKDGKADTKDAALILQFAAEKIEAF